MILLLGFLGGILLISYKFHQFSGAATALFGVLGMEQVDIFFVIFGIK